MSTIHVWSLTINTEDSREPSTFVVASEAECFAILRENHDPEGELDDLDDAEMVSAMDEAWGVTALIDSHEVVLP